MAPASRLASENEGRWQRLHDISYCSGIRVEYFYLLYDLGIAPHRRILNRHSFTHIVYCYCFPVYVPCLGFRSDKYFVFIHVLYVVNYRLF